jgi:uncharacterized protein (DUF2267 family)
MHNFNKYVQDGEDFIREVAMEAGIPWDTIKAGRFLRAVLHALRNRLPVPTSLQLIAQLPMLIKAVYVDGWRVGGEALPMRTIGDFIEEVREEGGPGLARDLSADLDAEEAIHAVFTVVKRHVSPGEIDDVLATLPEALRPVLAEA